MGLGGSGEQERRTKGKTLPTTQAGAEGTQGDKRPAHNAQKRARRPCSHEYHVEATALHRIRKENVRAEDPHK